MSGLNLSMFRAYDIRTPAAQLTDDLAIRLCRAEAVYFRDICQTNSVLIAHDARITGPRYLEIGASVFAESGLDVIVVPGVCSTSQFYFAAMQHPEMAAVMFGASHNPAGDTGQKILAPQVVPVAEHIGPAGGLDRIKELYLASAQNISKPGRITAYDPTDSYIRYSMELAGVEKGSLDGLSVFHDYLNGAAGREMLLAFGLAGARLTPLHFAANGEFPLGDPNPVKQGVIREGLSTMTGSQHLFGSFFDGDGDRVDFYRGNGDYLASSFVYAGLLPYIRERFPEEGMGVYADLKSNPLAIMEMARSGFSVSVIRNGHSQIKNSMVEDKTKIGTVEESAHFYETFRSNGGRFATENTLYISLLVARAWSENLNRFDELFDIQSKTSREREWGYKFPTDELRAEALGAVQSYFESVGCKALSKMANGYDLEATMMRTGIPFDVSVDTKIENGWVQVCQRTSQSENGLARWEAVSGDAEIAADAKAQIARIVRDFGAGDEYQG